MDCFGNEVWTGLGSHNNDIGCDANEYVVTVDGGTWQSEVSWEIVDAAGAVVPIRWCSNYCCRWNHCMFSK